MRFSKIFLSAGFLFGVETAQAQAVNTVALLDSGHTTSLRGLSVVNDTVVWASGSNGTVVRSVDGGKHFQWLQVPGFEKRDFRDIEAFDARTAVIIAIAEPAQILRTTDGGRNWNVVFTDSAAGMFLDALYFTGAAGTVVGDPVNGKLFIANTTDSGKSWQPLTRFVPTAETGEAFFASSGTNLHGVQDPRYGMALVTGGKRSRIIVLPRTQPGEYSSRPLPLLQQGTESTGANSIAAFQQHAVIVGGDFTHPTDTSGNCIMTHSGGDFWEKPVTAPGGYRSCVIYVDQRRLLTCGITGVDASDDGGKHWYSISSEGYHVVQKAKHGKAIFFAGGRGRIGKWMEK
jgi:photosystem II stability/assembly factor-like uncharacterized protein